MTNQPKNILLILTDQQRWDTIGAAGHPFMKTPNLDRLVREGTRFDAAYSPCPVCVPARASLLYGRDPLSTGCLENEYAMPDDAAHESLMTRLSRAGYRTQGIGKMHFTPDPHALRGFDARLTQEEMVLDASKDDYLRYLKENGCGYALEPHGVRGEAYYVPQLSPVPPQHHPTQWIGDRSVEWLEKEGAGSQPFFLFTSFIHPHPPFAPPTPWHKLYRAPDMPLPKMPDDADALLTWTNRWQNRYKGRDSGRDIGLHRLIKAFYWASVSFIDHQVGRLLDTLERLRITDDTLIVFTSDHGEFLGDYNCFGKRSFMDSAARIPLLCRLSERFEAGAVCAAPASLLDVLPTVLGCAGEDAGEVDGCDLAELAAGRNPRDVVFGHYRFAEQGMYMAVTSRWKYIWSARDGKELLFDRLKDPDELRNRAYNVACTRPLGEMRAYLQAHLSTRPGAASVVNEKGWISYPPYNVPSDPDAGLLFQDPPCFLDRFHLNGYSDDLL